LTARRRRKKVTDDTSVEAAPEAIVAVDAAGVIRVVNRQSEDLFGYEHDELVGKELETLVPDQIQAVQPEDQARYFADATARPTGEGLELTAMRKDGTEFPVDISLSSLETADGVLVSAAVRDVTDRKRIEMEKVQLGSELHQAQRDAERATLEAQLHQSNRLESVGQLAGGIAHDFDNLLAAIMNYAALAAAGLEDLTACLGVESDEAAVIPAQDIAEVHEDLFDLAPVGSRALAVNARDAMAGSGQLRITTTAFEAGDDAHPPGLKAGSYVRLTVSDTGPGMAPEVVSRAFEPFFTTKAKGEGSGLGLATVYGITTQAGGDVVISSELGFGTTKRSARCSTERSNKQRRGLAAQMGVTWPPRREL